MPGGVNSPVRAFKSGARSRQGQANAPHAACLPQAHAPSAAGCSELTHISSPLCPSGLPPQLAATPSSLTA